MPTISTLGVRRVREANLSRTLSLIHKSYRISRADIVRETGLSATTVSHLVNVLLESGFVHESGVGESSGGRPPIMVAFNYRFRYLLGVDMGATHLTVALTDLAGKVTARRYERFDVAGDPAGTIEAILALIEGTLEDAQQPFSNVLGVGIAVPAPLEGERLDRPSGVILPSWDGFDLIAALQPALPLPISVENDANAGAIAEKWWGMGTEQDNLAYIKLGTGVGGGLITNGAIFRGSGGTAGEIGHTTIDLNGPLCRCGKRGCLESYLRVPALIERVAQVRAVSAQRRTASGQTQGEESPVDLETIEAIIDAAHAGDAQCREVLEQAGRYLGVGIANLLNLLNPGLIVLGGEVAAAGDFFLEAVRNTVRERAMPKAAQEAKICFSGVGDDAVAIGAATVVLEHAFEPANLSRIIAAG
jgi:glucokinase-like ROK family protein